MTSAHVSEGSSSHHAGSRTGPLPRLRGSWGQEIYSAITELDSRVDLISSQEKRPQATEAAMNEVRQLLLRVERIATDSPPLWSVKRLVEWWTGVRVETCWSLLHEAEIRIVAISDSGRPLAVAMESALAHAQRLDPDDPIRVRLETLAKDEQRRHS